METDMRTEIKKIYEDLKSYQDKEVLVSGWVRTIRSSKEVAFVELNDGTFRGCQIVVEKSKIKNFDEIIKQLTGASMEARGKVVLTPNAKQPFEINADAMTVLGECAPDYPLQKKGHTMEFLREHAYLRARTNTFNAVFRIRSVASYAIHTFFQERGFVYVHTPIITASDCEGAGDMFQVTTLDLDRIAKDGKVDYSKDFFNRKVFMTVSGQIDEECITHAFANTYTFGPTFRAEKSNTTRHAAEFWMMEPEMCFTDLKGVMRNEEEMLKFVLNYVLEKCPDELNFLNKFVDNTLLERLNNVVSNDFVELDYTKAIEMLKNAPVKFEFPVEWGMDLQSEHERYVTEKIFKKPVFLINYPKDIKAFYMRLNDDGKTVAAVDLLVPGVGELIGGSQREERLEVLLKRMEECGLRKEDYQKYINLRRYGTNKHGGYGLGFERLIMYITGIQNIRDVELYPRTLGTIL